MAEERLREEQLQADQTAAANEFLSRVGKVRVRVCVRACAYVCVRVCVSCMLSSPSSNPGIMHTKKIDGSKSSC